MNKKLLRYTESHEWLNVEGDHALIGITDYAQETLGAIVYVDLPSEGESFQKGDAFGALESVKAASDLYLPVAGTILEVNQQLLDQPELLNDDPFGSWIVKIKLTNKSEVDALLDRDAYEAHIK